MGFITDLLNNQIKRSNDSLNQYNADLNKYRQGIEDAKKAKKLFEESATKMDSLILETDGVFQGAAATQFCLKLSNYNKAIKKMPAIMDKRIKAFERRISELEGQKRWCEIWSGFLNGFLTAIKVIV